jgi:long-chain acyl-CoA synthetase
MSDAAPFAADKSASPPLPAGWPFLSIAEAHARLTAPGARFEIEDVFIRGALTRTWKNAPRTLRDVFEIGRAQYGDRTFLVYENDRATYAAFARAAIALAHRLADAGVKKGDRVCVIMRNLPEWPVAFFAGVLAGAIVTPLNAWWTGPELEFGLFDAAVKIAIVDEERLERIREALPRCPELKLVLVARAAAPAPPLAGERRPLSLPSVDSSPASGGASAVAGIESLESVIGSVSDWPALPDRPYPDVPLAPDDDVTIFYTSGTTGRPKGALGTHRNMTSNILTSAFNQARGALRRGAQPAPAPSPQSPQRATLLAVPLFHVTGCSSNMVPIMFAGAKLVLMHRWDAEAAMKLIEAERVTQTGGVPTIAWQLIEHPARERYDLSSLDMLTYGGAPSAPELVRRIKEVFPKVSPGNAWGMTETTATFCGHVGEDYINRPSSCGCPPPIGEAKILDEENKPLPRGAVGELWVKGPQVVQGYWNRPEANAQTFVDGWLKTGDLATSDEEGFITIVDRSKDMIIRGGENIYSVEVENVLYAHPAVMDAALIAIPHRTLGEEPGAVVTLKPGASASEDELRAFVRSKLAAFKVPVRVAFWSEMLPRNPNGKIMKGELKRAFE